MVASCPTSHPTVCAVIALPHAPQACRSCTSLVKPPSLCSPPSCLPQLIGTWTYLFDDGRAFKVSETTIRLQEGEEEARRN